MRRKFFLHNTVLLKKSHNLGRNEVLQLFFLFLLLLHIKSNIFGKFDKITIIAAEGFDKSKVQL